MIGGRLRSARLSRRFTQEQLYELSGVTLQDINRYENEKSGIKADKLKLLASALNVSSDYLLGLTDNPTPPGLASSLSMLEAEVVTKIRQEEYLDVIETMAAKIRNTA